MIYTWLSPTNFLGPIDFVSLAKIKYAELPEVGVHL